MAQLSTEDASRELVRHLRGAVTQQALSRRLGFTSNVVYTWESGRRFPEVSALFRLADAAGVPVRERVLEFFRDAPPQLRASRFTSPRTVQRIVQLLVGQSQKRELAQRIGVDRTTLTRWLSGKTEPRLPEFLRLVDVTSQRLLRFIGLFVDPSELPSTRAAYRDLQVQQKLAYDIPWSHAILRALELQAYRSLPRHQPGFLGRQIGLSPKDEHRYLAELESAGQIRWDGTHYAVERVLTVDTREDPDRNRQLKVHWARTGLERLEQPTPSAEALFSFNLFAVSEQSFQKIRDLHLDYYDRVRAIVDESPHADRVVLLNLQLIPLRSEP